MNTWKIATLVLGVILIIMSCYAGSLRGKEIIYNCYFENSAEDCEILNDAIDDYHRAHGSGPYNMSWYSKNLYS